MDWGRVAEALWKLYVPLEQVPDIAARLVCGLVALWFLRLVAVRRPRTGAGTIVAWLLWLGWQVCFGDGLTELKAVHRRGAALVDATDVFSQQLIALVMAGINFFLPSLSPVLRWGMATWRKMTLHQRMLLFMALLSGYAIREAFHMFGRHRKTVRWALFHASFLVAGPCLWQLAGFLPSEWLPICLSQIVTVVPTLASLLVMGQAEKAKDSPALRSRKTSKAPPGVRLWLSYWSCWPLLALVEVSLVALPRLAPYYGQVGALQSDLQRMMLVFVLWLQLWQGCWFLQFTMRNILANTSVLEKIAMCFGARGLWLLRFARGNVGASGVAATATGFQVLRRLGRRLWLYGMLLGLGCVLLAMLVWLFYRAVALVMSIATMALWCFAAMDSADTLSSGSEEFYSRKLAFWVLAMLWGQATQLPYVGVILSLFTPVAFSLWLVAGEPILRRLVLRMLLLPLLKQLPSADILRLEAMQATFLAAKGPMPCLEDSDNGSTNGADDTGGVGGVAGVGEDADALSGVDDTGGTGGEKMHGGSRNASEENLADADAGDERSGSLRQRSKVSRAAKK